MLAKPYHSHIWRVPKDDIYQAGDALRKSRDYVVSHIQQLQVSGALGIRKRLLDIAQNDLKIVDAAIEKIKSEYPDADLAQRSVCGTKFTTTGWTCTRDSGHTGPCAAVPIIIREVKKFVKVPPPNQGFWTCRICLRSKFTRPGQPHRCQGGSRKRFSKYARMKNWDNCFIPTPKTTSCQTLHLSKQYDRSHQ